MYEMRTAMEAVQAHTLGENRRKGQLTQSRYHGLMTGEAASSTP